MVNPGDSALRLKLENLLISGFASDLKIIVIQPNKIEEEIKAHKIFLQDGSAILNSIIRENGDQIVFENVELEIVKLMLKYLYTGAFDLGKELLPALKLLDLATKYEIKGLVEKCENTLDVAWYFEINHKEALPLFEEAKLSGHIPIMERAIKYISRNGSKMLKCPDFANLRMECLIEIIKEDGLKVDKEMEVFEAIYRWGEAECKQRSLDANDHSTMRTILAKVLPHVRFPLMAKEEFERKVLTTELLGDKEVLELMTFIVSSNYSRKSSRSVGRFTAAPRTLSFGGVAVESLVINMLLFLMVYAALVCLLMKIGYHLKLTW